MKVIRVLKDSDSSLSNVTNKQLSEISGVSTKYITRNKANIEEYYKIAQSSSDTDYNFAANRSLKVYIDLSFKTDDKFMYRNLLGAIAGYLLKWKYKKLKHLNKSAKIIEIGINIIEIMGLINSRKDTSKGTPLHSQLKSVKQLFRGNKVSFVDELFKRTDGYYAGNSAKKWQLTKLGEQLLDDIIKNLFENIHLCPHFGSTYSSICNTETRTQLVDLDLGTIQTLSLSSVLHIFNMSVGFNNNNNSLIVSMEHTSNTDETLGRTYNLFCRLRSNERLQFGYKAYDISCALQTICLQLIEANENDYPILTSYSKDKAFKQALRASIANDLNIPITDVKAKLTAFANGGISGKDKHPIYIKFQEESDRLRREVLSHTAINNPWLLEQAINQSKRNLPEDIDWFNLKIEDNQTMARNKSSVFFFIWTYYERMIRKVMLNFLIDGIEVHDAVYSKLDIKSEIIENHIYYKTSFKIILDTN